MAQMMSTISHNYDGVRYFAYTTVDFDDVTTEISGGNINNQSPVRTARAYVRSRTTTQEIDVMRVGPQTNQPWTPRGNQHYFMEDPNWFLVVEWDQRVGGGPKG